MGRRDVVHKLVRWYSMPLGFLGRINNRIFGENVYQAVAEQLSAKGDNVVRYELEPYAFKGKDIEKSSLDHIAIVMQGPILYDHDFSFRTLEMYRYIYPQVDIILSTWKDVRTEFINKCKSINIRIVLNDEPDVAGASHVNYQLKSTLTGINVAINNGCKYIMKTRTDQRFSRHNFLEIFIGMLDGFPLSRECKCQRKRLIFLGDYITAKNIPFHISDQFSFGEANDVLNLYDIPFCKNMISDENTIRFFERLEYNSRFLESINVQKKEFNYYAKKLAEFCPEVYIITNFYKKNIGEIDFDVDDLLDLYNGFLHNCCILIDGTRNFGFYWPKYDIDKYKVKNTYEGSRGVDFYEWLKIYFRND